MKSLNFTRNIFPILVLAFTFLLVGRVEGQVVIVNFDNDNNFSSSISLTSYGSHSYMENSWNFIISNGLRNTTSTQDGVSGAIGTYSWRLRDAISSFIASYSGTQYISMVSFDVRRWDNSPEPIFSVSYSFDGGSNWVLSNTIINNSFLNNSSQWKNYQLIIINAQQCSPGQFKVKIERNSGERVMIDNFNAYSLPIWTGSTSSDPTVAANWSPAVVPASTASVIIPSGLTNYPSFANNSTPSFASITIDAGASLTLQTGSQLTLTGTLTNNGTMTIESGATFLQGTSLAGSGTYNVKQAVIGAGGAGSAPTGRFWYMGVPLNNLTRGAAFGNAGTDNRLWSWSESGQPQWSLQISDNSTVLSPTTGYVFRTSSPSTTLNFSGTSLYSIDASIPNLSNSGGSFAGCHLMSNPYTAYLDWEQVFTASTNISSTYCIPTFNGSSMVYDTYNASGNIAVFPSGVAMTSFIAPMQAFWVVVNPNTQGTLYMTKAMLSHQAGAVGLKDITSFPAFARLNLVSGDFYDQVVVYTDVNATAELEDYDSKKFFLSNKPQVYCAVGNEKLVINALKQGKAQTSSPLTIELPSTQVYKFEMAESFIENGLVILEDKQEGIFQDMGVNPTYEFFGNSGVIADRFVLHFQLPNGTNNEGQAGVEDLTSAQIDVISNQQGEILVSLSSDLTATGDIQIFDGAGRLVGQKEITSSQTGLQLSNGMGVYFVRVQTPMKTEMKKVMVY